MALPIGRKKSSSGAPAPSKKSASKKLSKKKSASKKASKADPKPVEDPKPDPKPVEDPKPAASKKPSKKAPKGKTSGVEVEKIVRTLPVNLTTDEMADRGKQVGNLQEEIEEIEQEKKETVSHFKSRLDGKKHEMTKISKELASGRKLVPVDCEIHRDFKKGRIKTVRVDSGEVLEDRQMSNAERQGKLFDDEDVEGADDDGSED